MGVLWSLRTNLSYANGETPFGLLYGAEAVIPVEVGPPTFRLMGFDEEDNNQRMREYMNFTDELGDQALFRMQKYKHLMARSYNRRVMNPQFKFGDLVMKLYSANHLKDKKMLSPKWTISC
ncbi:hypothetical protein LIER_36047 [Lithospermum erythrorhizon]|uniref:Uncharacterized protein n=1 Tax=Lithospermum erythrorhizon TaxID=34254 RepID=A0AAV3P4R7_LITER